MEGLTATDCTIGVRISISLQTNKRRRATIVMETKCKKAEQLGMPIGTASNRLRKAIIFNLLKRLNENYCHQCSSEITSVDELSIEHKTPYLHSGNPVALFFDIENVAFSHLSCNSSAARRNFVEHGNNGYKRGCRCEICRAYNTQKTKAYRQRKIN